MGVIPLALVDDEVYVCFCMPRQDRMRWRTGHASFGSLTILSGKVDNVDAAKQGVAAV
jgi:hypothetical protein